MKYFKKEQVKMALESFADGVVESMKDTITYVSLGSTVVKDIRNNKPADEILKDSVKTYIRTGIIRGGAYAISSLAYSVLTNVEDRRHENNRLK